MMLLPLKRDNCRVGIHTVLKDEDEPITAFQRRAYGMFLLDLGKETLSDEAYGA